MQNCPITLSETRSCYPILYGLESFFTRLHGGGPGWGSAYQTLRRLGGFFYDCTRTLFTRLRSGGGLPGWVRVSNLVRARGGFCPHSLTTRPHGERQNKLRCLLPALLHTLHKSRDPLTAYREGYGGSSTRLYGERACYQTVRRLSSLCNRTTNQPRWRRRQRLLLLLLFFSNRNTDLFLSIIIIHLLHSHIHCDLDHSCSILTLHDLHFFLNPRHQNFPPAREIFFTQHSWQHCLFQISRHFQISCRWRGRSRDRGSGGGNFILEKIFTSPGTKLPIYYWGCKKLEGLDSSKVKTVFTASNKTCISNFKTFHY